MVMRHVVPATVSENGLLRPFVPYVARFQCWQCDGAPHEIRGEAIVDTGTDDALFPAESLAQPDGPLWAGHGVDWGKLTYAGKAGFIKSGDREVRLAPVAITVFGVTITRAVRVSEPGYLPRFPLLGRNDLFRTFDISFMWGHNPPFMVLEAVGGQSDALALAPRTAGLPFRELEAAPVERAMLTDGLRRP